MKTLATLFAALALAGCTTAQSWDQFSYGSWLDHVGERKAARHPFAPGQEQAVREQADALRARADTVRDSMAREKDRVRRIAYLRELRDIGDQLRPLETQLREGGTS